MTIDHRSKNRRRIQVLNHIVYSMSFMIVIIKHLFSVILIANNICCYASRNVNVLHEERFHECLNAFIIIEGD
mgnify:CR=1 FL=1